MPQGGNPGGGGTGRQRRKFIPQRVCCGRAALPVEGPGRHKGETEGWAHLLCFWVGASSAPRAGLWLQEHLPSSLGVFSWQTSALQELGSPPWPQGLCAGTWWVIRTNLVNGQDGAGLWAELPCMPVNLARVTRWLLPVSGIEDQVGEK